MNKKPIKFICAVILATAILLSLTACNPYKKYTVDDHLLEVSKRVQKHYIDSDEIGNYTGFTITKLYEDNDEFSCFLVELEPQGFFYVNVNNDYKKFGKYNISGVPLYSVMHQGWVSEPWRRYKQALAGEEPEPYEGIIWKQDDTLYTGSEYKKYWEVDNDGNFVEHTDSPFKVAGIGDEKKYFLRRYSLVNGELRKGYANYVIPAVKCGDKYLNLISMEEFEYERAFDENKIPNYDTWIWKMWRGI